MKQSFVGGQAVLDGVLMVFEDEYSVAVQTPTGIQTTKNSTWLLRSKLLKIPFLRGPIAFLIMAYLGLSSMLIASKQASTQEDDLSWTTLILTATITLAFIAVLILVLPLFITTLLVSENNPLLFNFLDGAVRIVVFLLYVALIAQLPDIKKLFGYHGAEHQVIHAYEKGTLTLASARKQPLFLARCGTTFVVLVLLVAILVYSLTPINLPFMQLLTLRVLMLIPIASLSYEFMRLSHTNKSSLLVQALLTPGYWVQRLTVRKPSDQQLRVALAALKAVVKK
ncbi:MAG: DUF1385 domain-containing protein [Candidatus Woesearchaeota archaeon]